MPASAFGTTCRGTKRKKTCNRYDENNAKINAKNSAKNNAKAKEAGCVSKGSAPIINTGRHRAYEFDAAKREPRTPEPLQKIIGALHVHLVAHPDFIPYQNVLGRCYWGGYCWWRYECNSILSHPELHNTYGQRAPVPSASIYIIKGVNSPPNTEAGVYAVATPMY